MKDIISKLGDMKKPDHDWAALACIHRVLPNCGPIVVSEYNVRVCQICTLRPISR